MSRAFDIHLPPEQAYRRRGLFAIELLDPVTLERVWDGVRVVADGLQASKPSVNSSGMFFWLNEDVTRLRRVTVEFRTLPYESFELKPADLILPPVPSPVTTIELRPRADYPFSAGVTAARGTLIEDRSTARVPVRDADIRLRWLDDDGTTWHEATTVSRTDARGDFVAVLRLAAADTPQIDAGGAVTVRIRVRRGADERTSGDLKIGQGRVADPSTLNALTLVWDELQP